VRYLHWHRGTVKHERPRNARKHGLQSGAWQAWRLPQRKGSGILGSEPAILLPAAR